MACGERTALGVAEVLRDHVASLRLSPEQGKAAAHILGCRTGRLGGHLVRCDRCKHRHYAYHSCRDRHCPRCGSLDQAMWAEAQQSSLLPVSYFHVVFTVPESLRPFFLREGRVHALEALFAASSETLMEVAARRHLRPGILAVLHTWNQKQKHHPHTHCLVTGGGVGTGGFVIKEKFLFHFKVLRAVFRGKLLQKLRGLLKEDKLSVARASGYHLLDDAFKRTWNVEVRRSLAGPEVVIKYFARYVRRISLSDRRVKAYDGRTVSYTWRNRRDGNKVEVDHLDAPTFCQRFLSHVLPPRFVRIRRYGILSNRACKSLLAESRKALGAEAPTARLPETRAAASLRIFGQDPTRCPDCQEGRLVIVASWRATRVPLDLVLANLLPRAP